MQGSTFLWIGDFIFYFNLDSISLENYKHRAEISPQASEIYTQLASMVGYSQGQYIARLGYEKLGWKCSQREIDR